MPTYGTTSRWTLRKLLGSNLVSDIDSGFDALASDIDALPLSLLPASTSGATATAVDGQMLNCTGGHCTVTLPASAKGLLGVRASTPTGVFPVTVAAAGGSLIKGPGHESGVTSIALGAPGAYVVLLWDGASWLVVSGQQDTGWVPLTLGGGVSQVSGAYVVGYRLLGDRVWLRGSAFFTSTTSITVTTLPTGARPASVANLGPVGPGVTQASVTTAGALSLAGSGMTNAYLDDASFPLLN